MIVSPLFCPRVIGGGGTQVGFVAAVNQNTTAIEARLGMVYDGTNAVVCWRNANGSIVIKPRNPVTFASNGSAVLGPPDDGSSSGPITVLSDYDSAGGNFLYRGSGNSASTFDRGVASFKLNGTFNAAKTIANPNGTTTYLNNMDSSVCVGGNIYLGGLFEKKVSNARRQAAGLAKYAASTLTRSAFVQFSGAYSGLIDRITADSSGNVYFAGRSYSTSTSVSATLFGKCTTALAASYKFISAEDNSLCLAIGISPDGATFYFLREVSQAAPRPTYIIAVTASTGAIAWQKQLTLPTGHLARNISVTPAGDILFWSSYSIQTTAPSTIEYAVSRLNSSGVVQESKKITVTGTTVATINGALFNSAGSQFWLICFGGDFGQGPVCIVSIPVSNFSSIANGSKVADGVTVTFADTSLSVATSSVSFTSTSQTHTAITPTETTDSRTGTAQECAYTFGVTAIP